MGRRHQHVLRVRYGECDPQGIVFNANYLMYADVAFTELWREAIGPWLEMTERGYDAVVAETRLIFRAPARFDDEIAVGLQIARLGRLQDAHLLPVRSDEPDLGHADALVDAGRVALRE